MKFNNKHLRSLLKIYNKMQKNNEEPSREFKFVLCQSLIAKNNKKCNKLANELLSELERQELSEELTNYKNNHINNIEEKNL